MKPLGGDPTTVRNILYNSTTYVILVGVIESLTIICRWVLTVYIRKNVTQCALFLTARGRYKKYLLSLPGVYVIRPKRINRRSVRVQSSTSG